MVNNLVREVAEVKKANAAPNNIINKKIDSLKTQVEEQGTVIFRQPRYLEGINRKERGRI